MDNASELIKTCRVVALVAVAILVMTVLSGCSQVGMVTDRAAQANDAAIESAVFAVCNGVSVGSVRRKFDTPEKAATWSELCAVGSGWVPEQ